jgi:hypothetical protein
MKWDLWVDYQRTDGQGLTHANVADAEPGVSLVKGEFVIVGDEDADPAVAEVVEVKNSGVVLVRVLPGPAEDHLHLVSSRRPV